MTYFFSVLISIFGVELFVWFPLAARIQIILKVSYRAV